MGESNGSWGELAEYDNAAAEAWDAYASLPDPGVNRPLDSFCERKRITIPSLVRLGARLSEPQVLAFAFPGGIKYRHVVTDKRWSWTGSEWKGMRIVRAGAKPADRILVVEGETDGARLTELYPECDVGVMPGGAGYFPPEFASQLAEYRQALIALDNDAAGERGAAKILPRVPHAVRFAPPNVKDWCELNALAPPLPDIVENVQSGILVAAGDLLELEVPEVVSYFDNAILPVGGLMVIHGWLKNYKSYIAFDLLGRIAQGLDWATFEPTEEPVKVAVVQYEIPWAFYQARVVQLRQHAQHVDLFDVNFLTWTPLTRPRIGLNGAEEMVKHLQDAGVQVVLFDPIRRLAGGIDMDREQDVRPVLTFFEQLQDQGITVIATHHDNKEYGKRGGGDPMGMTGSAAWGGDPDTIVSISLPSGHSMDSPQRNLNFTLRNAPPTGGRGFWLQENGSTLYTTTTFGEDGEQDALPGI